MIGVIHHFPKEIPQSQMVILRASSNEQHTGKKGCVGNRVAAVWKEAEKPHIVFIDDDLEGLRLSHSDPLWIVARIDGYNVARILIDQGSAVSVMYSELLMKLKIQEEYLTITDAPLFGFSSHRVNPLGTIVLPVKVGSVVMATEFVVVDSCSPHNEIFGRPWLHDMGAVASTYYQKLKFESRGGIETIWGAKPATRQEVLAGIKGNKEAAPGLKVLSDLKDGQKFKEAPRLEEKEAAPKGKRNI